MILDLQEEINLFFIDEAHAIHFWGEGEDRKAKAKGFREDFKRMDEILTQLKVSF